MFWGLLTPMVLTEQPHAAPSPVKNITTFSYQVSLDVHLLSDTNTFCILTFTIDSINRKQLLF